MAKRHRFLTGDDEHAVEVDRAPGGVAVTVDDGEPIAVELVEARAPGFVSWFADGRQRRAYVARRGGAFEVTIGERRFLVQPASARRGRHVVGGAEDAPGRITAPLAGVVVEVRAAAGDVLEAGATVLVLEAMKMQNEVQIPHDGAITAVHAAAGDNVDKGALLVEYEPAGE